MRLLKFEITDRATIAGLNRITDIIDRMEATAEVMERSGTHPAVLLAASYHEHVALCVPPLSQGDKWKHRGLLHDLELTLRQLLTSWLGTQHGRTRNRGRRAPFELVSPGARIGRIAECWL